MRNKFGPKANIFFKRIFEAKCSEYFAKEPNIAKPNLKVHCPLPTIISHCTLYTAYCPLPTVYYKLHTIYCKFVQTQIFFLHIQEIPKIIFSHQYIVLITKIEKVTETNLKHELVMLKIKYKKMCGGILIPYYALAKVAKCSVCSPNNC
jgi:hypothetical protein